LIATKESSYTQFATVDANNLADGLWPTESPAGQHWAGYAIGLMQAMLTNGYDTPMNTAWNWLANAQVAYEIFTSKIGYVFNLENMAVEQDKGLPYLTQSQIEDMAMWQYSGNGSSTAPTAQYYVAERGFW
jgi:hypothetical protein